MKISSLPQKTCIFGNLKYSQKSRLEREFRKVDEILARIICDTGPIICDTLALKSRNLLNDNFCSLDFRNGNLYNPEESIWV